MFRTVKPDRLVDPVLISLGDVQEMSDGSGQSDRTPSPDTQTGPDSSDR